MKKFKRIAVVFAVACLMFGFAGFAWGADADPVAETAAVVAPVKIDINTATIEQLTSLKGIGPALAQRIVDHRETVGPFKTLEDITLVKGIGPKSLEKIMDMITVGTPEQPAAKTE